MSTSDRARFPPLLVFALACASGGCTLLPVGETHREASPRRLLACSPELREHRAVFHCHSHLSHDSEGTFEEIAAAAGDLGLDIVLLTDHYEEGNIARSPRGVRDGVLFVPGVELRVPGGGSMLAVGPREDFERDAPYEAACAQLRDRGAFLVAGHIERLPQEVDLTPFEGIEVYNLHAQFRATSRWGLAGRFFFRTPDGFFEGAIEPPRENLARWDRLLAAGHRLTPLAGHDAHANVHILGATIGTYPEVFRLFSTRVLATELSEEAVKDALRRGRTWVVFDYLGDASGFCFSYHPAGASRGTIVGETVAYREGDTVEVALPRDARIRVLCDGELVTEATGAFLRAGAPGPGAYRCEAWLGERIWIISGAIYALEPGSETP